MWIDDCVLAQCAQPFYLTTWVPDFVKVVLGSSNQAETEVQVDSCAQDQVEILKRYGGGGTVVLYPGCVVFSFGMWVQHLYRNDQYFAGINRSLIACLESGFPAFAGKLSQQGISDLAYEGRKICGSSLFRSKQYLLFQGSLLVEDGLVWIDRYLQHPSKEPAYREGRSHGDFVTFLSQHASVTPVQIQHHLATQLSHFLKTEMGEELVSPDLGHISYLLQKSVR